MEIWSIIVLLISIGVIFLCTSKLNINAYIVLISVAVFYGFATGIPPLELVESIKNGFGELFYKTGLIYLSGIIIGVVLDKTGAARSIAHMIFKMIGPKKAINVAAASGYLISIPINCDSGYIILYPMCRALANYIGAAPIALGTALAAGLLATHTLVPPTAGPTSVTLALSADMGITILFSLIVAAVAVFGGLFIARKLGCIAECKLTDAAQSVHFEMCQSNCPNAFHSFIPVLYPLCAICLSTFANLDARPFGDGSFYTIITILGDPTIALMCALYLSFTLINKKDYKVAFNGWLDEALKDAAAIVLINSAAGAFAEVISVSPLIDQLNHLLTSLPLDIGLLAPFLVAVIFKTAQGSSTVAMIATAGIMTPIIATSDIDPVFYVLAIGAGAMMFSHTNDSFFWVVSQFTGMNVKDMLKHYTIPTAIVGCTAFLCILVLQFLTAGWMS